MADNRRFKGHSSLDLSAIFGGIGGLMGGAENVPQFDSEGKITGFMPKSKVGALFMGNNSANDMTNELLLNNQEEANKLANHLKLLSGQQSLDEAAKNKALTSFGQSLVRTSDNPGELDPEVMNVARDAETMWGNNLSKGSLEANRLGVISKALTGDAGTEALLKQRKDMGNDALTTIYAPDKFALENQKEQAGIDMSKAATANQYNEIDSKNANPFSPMSGLNYDKRNGTISILEPGVNEYGDKTPIVPRIVTPDGYEAIRGRKPGMPTPAPGNIQNRLHGAGGSWDEPTQGRGVLNPSAMAASTEVTNAIPTPDNLPQPTPEEQAMIKKLSGSGYISDQIKLQELMDVIKSRKFASKTGYPSY